MLDVVWRLSSSRLTEFGGVCGVTLVEDEYDVGVYNLVSVPGQIDCRRLYRYNG